MINKKVHRASRYARRQGAAGWSGEGIVSAWRRARRTLVRRFSMRSHMAGGRLFWLAVTLGPGFTISACSGLVEKKQMVAFDAGCHRYCA